MEMILHLSERLSLQARQQTSIFVALLQTADNFRCSYCTQAPDGGGSPGGLAAQNVSVDSHSDNHSRVRATIKKLNAKIANKRDITKNSNHKVEEPIFMSLRGPKTLDDKGPPFDSQGSLRAGCGPPRESKGESVLRGFDRVPLTPVPTLLVGMRKVTGAVAQMVVNTLLGSNQRQQSAFCQEQTLLPQRPQRNTEKKMAAN
ncbi:MAG: hypothetical protein WA672_18985 [Candidatus Angelobacter sp.]